MAVSMSGDYLMLNALIPTAASVPSNPMRVGDGNNAISIQGLVIAGALAPAIGNAMEVQQSNDGVNWTSVGFVTNFNGANAFDLKSGDQTGVTQRFVRLVVTASLTNPAIVNISAQLYRA